MKEMKQASKRRAKSKVREDPIMRKVQEIVEIH